MLVDDAALLARWPAGSRVLDREPLGLRPHAARRVTIETPSGREAALVRTGRDGAHAENLVAVSDALSRHPGPWPATRDFIGDQLIEVWVDGISAVAVDIEHDALRRGVEAIARLHQLDIHEGLDWDRAPADLVPGPEMQLFRLGFAAAEREAARPLLERAQEALLAGPFGFGHRALTSDHLLFSADSAWIVDFEDAGHAAHLFDLEAFLLTSGADAPARGRLVAHYAGLRRLNEESVAALADLAGLIWGLNWLLDAPRRQIEALGDDGKSAALRLMAMRVDGGIRETAGSHPIAHAIREVLWA